MSGEKRYAPRHDRPGLHPTYVEVADLFHGYELVWRDAVRLHVKWAGVGGRLWLVLDAGLQTEKFRLRVGSVVGEVAKLLHFSIGQGKRSGVHQFGVFTRGLFHEFENQQAWVGVGIPPAAAVASQASKRGAD